MRSIGGNHFPDICIPQQPTYSPTQAQESIIGLEIPWYDFGGNLRFHIVAEDDLQDHPTKIVLRRQHRDTIELRVVWRIPIGQTGSFMWHAYVDTMTNELMWVEQLFYT